MLPFVVGSPRSNTWCALLGRLVALVAENIYSRSCLVLPYTQQQLTSEFWVCRNLSLPVHYLICWQYGVWSVLISQSSATIFLLNRGISNITTLLSATIIEQVNGALAVSVTKTMENHNHMITMWHPWQHSVSTLYQRCEVKVYRKPQLLSKKIITST
jgi:hypothetical protein